MTLNFSQFCYNWPGEESSYKDVFSYEGKKALFEYLEEYEESTGEEIEFDPIALCCEYSEEKTALDHAENYGGFDANEIEDEDDSDKEERALLFLQDHTQVIEFDEGVIIQNF